VPLGAALTFWDRSRISGMKIAKGGELLESSTPAFRKVLKSDACVVAARN
jgi:hypothetical protein